MSEQKPIMKKCVKNDCPNEQAFYIRIKKKGWQGGTGAGVLMGLALCSAHAMSCKPEDVVTPESFILIKKALSIVGMKVTSIDDLEVFPVGIDSPDAKVFRRIQGRM